MSSVSRNKRRVDDPVLSLPVPPPVVGVEWFFDNQFVPGTDCAEDPWLDFEAELKSHTLVAQTAFFAASHVLDCVEPSVTQTLEVFKQEPCLEPQEQPASLSSSASLSLVLRTCHHCKTVRSCQPCVCTRTFCDRCIEKYPTIPQGPDPSGFRQQCPHCQELCTCARCRQRRMEEAAPAKARTTARNLSVKRQHSEEDEEYVSKEDMPSAVVLHTDVRMEAPRKDSDFDDDDACGSWKADDLSLSPLRPSSSSSSCGSRLKFDDISARAKSGPLPRRSHSLSDVFAPLVTVSDAPLKIEYSLSSLIHTSCEVPAAAALPHVMLTKPASISAPAALTSVKQSPITDEADVEDEDEDENDEEDNDEAYAEKHSRNELKREKSPMIATMAVAPRPKKARRVVPEKSVRSRSTQARKVSADAPAAVSPSSERSSGPVCRECGTRNTPLWRAGPDGTKSLCNRCGIRWMRGVPLSRGNSAAKACRDVLADESIDQSRSRQVSCK